MSIYRTIGPLVMFSIEFPSSEDQISKQISIVWTWVVAFAVLRNRHSIFLSKPMVFISLL